MWMGRWGTHIFNPRQKVRISHQIVPIGITLLGNSQWGKGEQRNEYGSGLKGMGWKEACESVGEWRG